MRRYLDDDENAPIKHPEIVSGLQTRSMGVRLPERRGATAATIIPSVGCPMNFYETGDELFDLMEGFENSMKVQTFFVMDENFLLHRARAMQLLEHMKAAGKSWFWRCALRQTRFASIPCRNWLSWACRGSGWGWNR